VNRATQTLSESGACGWCHLSQQAAAQAVQNFPAFSCMNGINTMIRPHRGDLVSSFTMSSAVSDPSTPLSTLSATHTVQPSTARYVLHVSSIGKRLTSTSRRASQDSLAELRLLGNIIQSSIEQIEAVAISNNFTFPSQDSPFNFKSEAPCFHPAIDSAGMLITSAAAQLMALVRPAPRTIADISMQVKLLVSLATDHCSRYENYEVPCFHRNPHCSQHAYC
jgi:hypothetical protein